MQAPKRLGQAVVRQIGRRPSSSYVPPGGTVSTYNDLPTPQGSWKTQFDANQRKYNAHLVAGVAVFAGSILFGKICGFWEANSSIPERPATIDSYK